MDWRRLGVVMDGRRLGVVMEGRRFGVSQNFIKLDDGVLNGFSHSGRL